MIFLSTSQRWLRKANRRRILALIFIALAGLQLHLLRLQPIVPEFSMPWRPMLHRGANLLWIGDGWDWYVSGLILLLGAVGILLSGKSINEGDLEKTPDKLFFHGRMLAVNLGLLAGALLFVGSGNLLSITLCWVLLDGLMMARGIIFAHLREADQKDYRDLNRAQGLSLLGSVLLLIGLLPAGPAGPGQHLQGGLLPIETSYAILAAAALRAGTYPLHLWLLPTSADRMPLADRFLGHLVPALCGLWLLGWGLSLSGGFLLSNQWVLLLVLLALLGSSVAAWTANNQPGHTTFVLITSVGMAALAGALSPLQGPSALIWPTTAFALGGGLWLVGERVWQEWGWQIPVSVGALALIGVPFTPGFLTQPALARMGSTNPFFYGLFILVQSLQVAALLRSWASRQSKPAALTRETVARLIVAIVALAIPLGIAGFYPRAVTALASLPDAIPESLGSLPSVIAGFDVWFTLGLPLALGILAALFRARMWPRLGGIPDQMSRLASLEWMTEGLRWGNLGISAIWDNVIEILEGPGHFGWLMVFVLLILLLLR